ncbi:unnamed protein product [Caenorhabditis brenneri]
MILIYNRLYLLCLIIFHCSCSIIGSPTPTKLITTGAQLYCFMVVNSVRRLFQMPRDELGQFSMLRKETITAILQEDISSSCGFNRQFAGGKKNY